jgi:hypothetical protein
MVILDGAGVDDLPIRGAVTEPHAVRRLLAARAWPPSRRRGRRVSVA